MEGQIIEWQIIEWHSLYTYEFWLSLCKIVRSSVILLLPLYSEKYKNTNNDPQSTTQKKIKIEKKPEPHNKRGLSATEIMLNTNIGVVISDAAFRLTTARIISFCIFLESDSCVWSQFPLMIAEEYSSVLILPLQFFTVHRHDISPDFKTLSNRYANPS